MSVNCSVSVSSSYSHDNTRSWSCVFRRQLKDDQIDDFVVFLQHLERSPTLLEGHDERKITWKAAEYSIKEGYIFLCSSVEDGSAMTSIFPFRILDMVRELPLEGSFLHMRVGAAMGHDQNSALAMA